jgi:hypothetical protein
LKQLNWQRGIQAAEGRKEASLKDSSEEEPSYTVEQSNHQAASCENYVAEQCFPESL